MFVYKILQIKLSISQIQNDYYLSGGYCIFMYKRFDLFWLIQSKSWFRLRFSLALAGSVLIKI